MFDPNSYPYHNEPITMEEINELLDFHDEHLAQEDGIRAQRDFWETIKPREYTEVEKENS
jgi:hypothetical protein